MEEDIEELKRLFYTNSLTQYGKRKLINYYEQRNKKLEEENKQLKDNYKNQIEHTTILAKALNLEEDAPIDEIYAEINKLKTNSIPTSVIENKKKEEREKCYQDLIGENARLQYHLSKTIPTEENEFRLQNIVEHFEKIKHSQSTVEINEDDIKAIKELIAVKEHLKHKYETYYKLYWEESIPVSLIQNKIDEIKLRLKDDCVALHEFQRLAKIDVLQELLEEREEDNEQ